MFERGRDVETGSCSSVWLSRTKGLIEAFDNHPMFGAEPSPSWSPRVDANVCSTLTPTSHLPVTLDG
jgi:hypothetical protein